MHALSRTFVLLATALALSAGCGGAQASVESPASAGLDGPPGPPPPPMRVLESLLPSDAAIVFRADLAQLRQTEHYALGEGWARAVIREEASDAQPLLDLVGHTQEVWGAFVPDPEREFRGVVVARGDYGPADERAILDRGGSEIRAGTYADLPVYYDGDDAFAMIGWHTIAIGDRAAVEAVLDAQQRGDGAGPSDAVVVAAMERVGLRQATFGVALRVTEALYEELDLPALLRSSVESGAAVLSLGDGLRAAAMLRTTSPMVAMAAVTMARSQLAEIRSEPELAQLGLGPLFAGLRIDADGPEAWLRLEVSAADLAGIVQHLQAMLGVGATAP